MAIPTYQTLMRPVLATHEDEADHDAESIRQAIADRLGLSSQDVAETLAGRERTVLADRVSWAITYLVQAGALIRIDRGVTRITSRGHELLGQHPDEIVDDDLKCFPEFRTFVNIPEPPAASAASAMANAGPSVWMVRAGRGGIYAHEFIARGAAVIGWGPSGDVSGLTRDEIQDRVSLGLPDYTSQKCRTAANTLLRFANAIRDGDLIATPEPSTRTVILGWVQGRYRFLAEPIGDTYRHAYSVRWFARLQRDTLSYGARQSLGGMSTLTQPTNSAELLALADAHATDPAPSPLAQVPDGPSAAAALPPQRVAIPTSVEVKGGTVDTSFQTFPLNLMVLVEQLHAGQLGLPDFQRSFVWSADATRELLVSMMRSFPAGALLFLQGGGQAFKARSAEGAPQLVGHPLQLVLDGQQRLTSLYQAMFGCGASRFFLDVGALLSGAEVNDAVRALTLDKAAAFESPQAQADALMMPLSAVRGNGAGRWRDDIVDLRDDPDPATVRRVLREVESAFIDPLVRYAFPVTQLPPTTELEAVCSIFETLNRTGKPLTPFELISARAFAGGHSLRDLWEDARERHPTLVDFTVEPYYVLQTLALRLGRSCKRGAVLALGSDEIAEGWDEVVGDMAAAVGFVRDQCGVVVEKWLPYRPMLIPLAAAWREVRVAGGTDRGAMAAKLRRWFWCACFTGEYESSSASLAERDALALREWLHGGEPPPVVAGFAWTREWRQISSRQQGLYRATMALTLTGRPLDFQTAAPLTRDVVASGKVDDHHVFPRGHLKDNGQLPAIDSILNHALIDRATNQQIGKRAPSVYLAEIRGALGAEVDRILVSQQLPTGQHSPLERDDFDAFLSWRAERLSELVSQACGQLGTGAAVDPERVRLNHKLEALELGLRELVDLTLEGEVGRVPGHVAVKVRERLAAAARSSPGNEPSAEDLDVWLQYFDLRELQDLIQAKAIWPAFEERFVNKERLAMRFGQVAELRNAIRHSRDLSVVALKDGEAALAWFSDALDPR